MVENIEQFLELYKEEIENIFTEAEVSKKTRKRIIKLLKKELEGVIAINPLDILKLIERVSLNTTIAGGKIIPMKKKKIKEEIQNSDGLSALIYGIDSDDYDDIERIELLEQGYLEEKPSRAKKRKLKKQPNIN